MKEIGICGTFDVENYGDLLLPLIAEKELTNRLGPVKLRRFSYFPKTLPGWPYEVTSLVELPSLVGGLDGLLIGGGHLIRFDKQIAANNYGPPTTDLHHPTAYWLTPALMALQQNIPVAWNAPGVNGCIPDWAEPLMETALNLSSYVAVRDEPSWRELARFAHGTEIAVVPDTAFGVARLFDSEAPGPDFIRLREAAGLTRPYVVVQATGGLDAFIRLAQERPAVLEDHQVVVLPIGPILGDDAACLTNALPGALHLPDWPPPLVLAELIGGADAAIGTSLHLAITALAFGVPSFRPAKEFKGKYSILSGFNTVYAFDNQTGIDPHWFAARLGAGPPSPATRAANERLSHHWDRIAVTIEGNRTRDVSQVLGRFWQTIPRLLEDWSGERDSAHVAVAELKEELADREAELAKLRDSISWKLTTPLRSMRRQYRRLQAMADGPTSNGQERTRDSEGGRVAQKVIRLDRIGGKMLATEPYGWAFVDDLFSVQDAKQLAETFPRDHFKTVAGYDGEKGYEYQARSLVEMGADLPCRAESLAPAWRQLAEDLLSPAYRSALTRLTRVDLTRAPMEANVFHYGPGAWLGPHVDLKDKIVTQVFYFNSSWSEEDGGCLMILGSSEMEDVVRMVRPVVGSAVVLVRSAKSWHAVSRVAAGCRRSRRSIAVTFYHPGSISTMWPPGDQTPLHFYREPDEELGLWKRLRSRIW